jgi:hypothetical protein
MRFQITFLSGIFGPETLHEYSLTRARQMMPAPYGAKVEEILLRPFSREFDPTSPFRERTEAAPAVAVEISMTGLAAFASAFDYSATVVPQREWDLPVEGQGDPITHHLYVVNAGKDDGGLDW